MADLTPEEQAAVDALVAGRDPRPGAMSRLPNFGRGNVDLNNRPVVTNPDGSISTVYSNTFGPDKKGQWVLVPGVREGLSRTMEPDEAFAHYMKTGEHLGSFPSQKEADTYAENLHEDQAQMYDRPGVASGTSEWMKRQPGPVPSPSFGDKLSAAFQPPQYGPWSNTPPGVIRPPAQRPKSAKQIRSEIKQGELNQPVVNLTLGELFGVYRDSLSKILGQDRSLKSQFGNNK